METRQELKEEALLFGILVEGHQIVEMFFKNRECLDIHQQ
jgi:hypothetical protein